MEGVSGVKHCESRLDGFSASGEVSTTSAGGRCIGDADVRRSGVSDVSLCVSGMTLVLGDEGVGGTTAIVGTGKGGRGRDGRRRIRGAGFGVGGRGRIGFVRVWCEQQASSSSRLSAMGERVGRPVRSLSAVLMIIDGLAQGFAPVHGDPDALPTMSNNSEDEPQRVTRKTRKGENKMP